VQDDAADVAADRFGQRCAETTRMVCLLLFAQALMLCPAGMRVDERRIAAAGVNVTI